MNTVRWIDENSSYWARKRGSPAPLRLLASLDASLYLLAEHDAGLLDTTLNLDQYLEKRVREWIQADHDDFVAYIKVGGYEARRDAIRQAQRECMPQRSKASVGTNRVGMDDGMTLEDAVLHSSAFAGSW